MDRQHRAPYIVGKPEEPPRRLDSATGSFSEDWLQRFVFENSVSIPIDEIEPAFAPLVPLCRELPTKSGPVDIVFINPLGLLTLVECKLWKNPEARREVVGQILDYAKDVCRWDYDGLQAAVRLARGDKTLSLFELAREQSGELDERNFADAVSRNLRRGRFLLLLLGDGIRENANQMAEFLDEHAHLNFALSLVEMGIFRLPDPDHRFVVLPRVLVQTVEVEKAVVRIEEGRLQVEPPTRTKEGAPPRRTKISEQVFFERLDVDEATKKALVEFLDRAREIGFHVEPGDSGIKLHSEEGRNFACFMTDGQVWNCDIASYTANLGHPEIGEKYLTKLAGLLPGGYVHKGKSRFYWTVKVKPNRYATLAEVMAQRDAWLELLRETSEELGKAAS